MPISIVCPKCTKRLNAPDALAGKRAKCPGCGTVVQVPEILMDAEVVPAPAPAPAPPPPPQPSIWDEDGDYRVASLPQPTRAAEEPARRPCPYCGEMIPVQAAKCRFCDEVFDKALRRKEKKRKSRSGYSDQDSDLTPLELVACFFCVPITCIGGIIYMIQGKPKGAKMLAVTFLCVIAINVIRFLIAVANQSAVQP